MIQPGARFDYVTVGHVTRDALEDEAGGVQFRAGGSAFYSALQAARLGLRTLILTQGVPDEIEGLLEPYLDELDLHVIAAERTTTLSTRGMGAARAQRVLAWAGPISGPIELDTAILHLAPVARETPVRWDGRAAFVGVTPQGLIRQWEPGEPSGEISHVPLDPALLPTSFGAAVISEQERKSCQALFSAADRCDAPVAVTAGSGPTTVRLPASVDESISQIAPPQPAVVRDDLGAGDVFAATFFVALAEGHTPLQAAALGNSAAAIRVSGTGPEAIGRRAAIIP
ncbi:MAG TPA: PfkB family carbohydrate kinase [Solirubrobacteraceae bacterium]|jgi:sugar/nucleoside kinase (ribokinase family)|nr:PfkB family carbohydrate kinase [Solirubrobacteraceae bacterium]